VLCNQLLKERMNQLVVDDRYFFLKWKADRLNFNGAHHDRSSHDSGGDHHCSDPGPCSWRNRLDPRPQRAMERGGMRPRVTPKGDFHRGELIRLISAVSTSSSSPSPPQTCSDAAANAGDSGGWSGGCAALWRA
jgi:hypothetical protein